MTTNPLRHALIALHTALGTWTRYPYRVHYCATCDALYDYWLGSMGTGIAVDFRRRWLAMYDAYREACRSGRLQPAAPSCTKHPIA